MKKVIQAKKGRHEHNAKVKIETEKKNSQQSLSRDEKCEIKEREMRTK